MADIPISPVTPVTNGSIVTAANPLPVTVVGGNVSLVLGSSGTASSISTGTAEVQLASVVVPAMGANDRIRIFSVWSYTNSGNNKTLRIRLGGASGVAYAAVVATNTAQAQFPTFISNAGATNSQKGGFAPSSTVGFGSSAAAITTGALETNAGTTVYFSGQPASGGETVTLESYTVELIRGV